MKLTDEQTERFKELYNEGKNDTEIAFALDVPVRSIRTKRKEFGWQQNGTKPKKRFTQDEINRIIELAKTHTMAEIARFVGASKFGVRDVLYRNGVEPVYKRVYNRDVDLWSESCDGFERDPCRDFTTTTDMLVMQYLSEGYSWAQIAMILHRDLDLLKRYYTQHKYRLLRAHEIMMSYGGIYSYKMQNRKEAMI